MKKKSIYSTVQYLCSLFLLVAMLMPQLTLAQLCGFNTSDGCSNTNYDNSFLKTLTYNNPATIEYDNFVSTFHSTIVRNSSGGFKVWGEGIANDGISNVLSPQDLNSTNYPALGTAKVYKVTGASSSTNNSAAPTFKLDGQFIALASDGLYAWGIAGKILSTSIKNTGTFGKISVNGKADGLPPGVSPTDVKMITASSHSVANGSQQQDNAALVIVTCSGDVWVLSENANTRGNGGAGSATVWSRVQVDATNYLTGIVAARISGGIVIAQKSDGTLWTWGSRTYLGNGTALNTTRNRATQMAAPLGTVKMIGISVNTALVSFPPTYYVLMTNGNLYAMGNNDYRQIGDWSATTRTSWVQPRYTSASGQVMNNIAWISPAGESDISGGSMAINVLTTSGVLYAWGRNDGAMLGVGTTGAIVDPAIPQGVSATDKIIAVETGGHTSMIVKECSTNFGYVGHRVNGSMGNGSAADVTETSYTFNTAPIEICSAEPVNLTPATAGPYCSSATLQLTGSPSGGTYAVISGPATVTSSGLVTFTGGGSAVVQYTSPSSCGAAISKSITLVSNAVTPGVIAADQTVISGGDPAAFTFPTAATGSGTVSYQWQSSTNGGTTWTDISGATANTYDPPAGITQTTSYRRTATSTLSGVGCTAYSNVVTVTVATCQSITTQPSNTPQNLCVGASATPLTVTATGATGYQWYYSDAATGGSVTTVSGATSATYTPPTVAAFATRYYFVTVTGICGTVNSTRTPVTVYAYPTSVVVSPAIQNVTLTSTPTDLTATATGATAYQWYSNTTNSNTGGTLISGATSSTYTPPTNALGTIYYYVVASSGSGCGTTSAAVAVTVQATCTAGTTAPAVSTPLFTSCPSAVANLNNAHTGTIPANATLVWFRDTAHTDPVTNPTAVGAGSYYAFYYSNAGNCYSPASTRVSVIAAVCSTCTAPADPQLRNLNSVFQVNAAPSGSVIQWHTSATPSSTSLLSNTNISVTSTPTEYWVFYYNTSSNCYSPGSKLIAVTNICCNIPTVNLNSVEYMAPPDGSTLVWYSTRNRVSGTLVNDSSAVGEGVYWPFFFNASTNTYNIAGAPVLVAIDYLCACYKPGATTGGAVLDTKVGISALGRAGATDADNWPMIRKGGHIALESKTKAFVPNRVAFSDADNNASTPDVPVGIAPANFVEGMMVYDTTNKCMKLYTSMDNGLSYAWYCISTPTCPD